MANSGRSYMHVYMGLFENFVFFGNQPNKMLIGEALLQFIYTDFQSLSNDLTFDTIDQFKTVHPYFSCCEPAWQAAFLRQLQNPQANSQIPDLKTLTDLQDKYTALLSDMYHSSSGYDERYLSEKLAATGWLQHTACFSRMKLDLHQDGTDTCYTEDYFITSLEECLFLELTEILKRRIPFKTCKNCGRLFIPKRSNMDYCPRIYTSDGKTCAEVGYTQTFAKNVKNDELLLAYTRAYKAHYARMTKPRKKTPNMTREAFEAWYQEAKQKLELARAGLLDAETYKAWLKE